jgi:prefoldin subunit 5
MFNNTKIMIETIKEQAVTISNLTRRVEDLDDIRIRANDEINKLNSRIKDLEYLLWEHDIDPNVVDGE